MPWCKLAKSSAGKTETSRDRATEYLPLSRAIAQGELSEKQILARAKYYGASARAAVVVELFLGMLKTSNRRKI
jgi:hypothetical protein